MDKTKYKLEIKPAINPKSRHLIEDALKREGYNVIGGGQHIDGSACDVSFEK